MDSIHLLEGDIFKTPFHWLANQEEHWSRYQRASDNEKYLREHYPFAAQVWVSPHYPDNEAALTIEGFDANVRLKMKDRNAWVRPSDIPRWETALAQQKQEG
ncbi:hypothetical protein Rleg5DRAFT_6237 [Rhizobium leguminosarum bv. viciae WSM1455]|nr:hypothetical protein Rleg5DRAFT_6237 [Rhizobium leguminosarum bv. viciae WSM1455]